MGESRGIHKIFIWAVAITVAAILSIRIKGQATAETGSATPTTADSKEVGKGMPELREYAILGEPRGTEGDAVLYGNREEEDVAICFTIEDGEQTWDAAGVKCRVFNKCSRELVAEAAGSSLKWEEAGEEPELHRAAFLFNGEPGTAAAYEVQISYRNRAGEVMRDGRAQEEAALGSFAAETGTYCGPDFILDHRPPEFSITYAEALYLADAEGNLNEDGRIPMEGYTSYYKTDITGEVRVQEEYAVFSRHKEEGKEALRDFALVIDGEDATGKIAWRIQEDASSRSTYIGTFQICGEGEHSVQASYEDAAGNRMEGGAEGTVTEGRYMGPPLVLDRTGPEIVLDFGVSPGAFADTVNYKDFGYWFLEELPSIKTEIKDGISGIRKIYVTLTGENGVEREIAEEFLLGKARDWEGTLSPKTQDFTGVIRVQAVDWCENTTELARGCIVESAKKHSQEGNVEIVTKTEPSRTVHGVDYYSGDVELSLVWQDLHSGLGSISYTVGEGISGETDYREEAGRNFEAEPEEEITFWRAEDFILEAASHNRNNVGVRAAYTDNAGHRGTAENTYHIDTTPPVITVEYDKNEPVREMFYNQSRTAIVTIRERNFDPDDVEFKITGPDGTMPSVSGWDKRGTGDDTEHWCTVAFQEDGDYTFSVAFKDLAGNPAEYDRVDSFTIDRTPPRLRAFYDNQNSRNGHYFAKGRKLTIEVLEHNFEEELMEVAVSAKNRDAVPPAVSPWTGEGDVHRAYVIFEEDGVYRVDIAGEDLAGHPLPEYEGDYFVIDQTPPVLEIRKIRDKSANRNAVMPEVFCFDENFNPGSVKVRLEGSRSGIHKAEGDRRDSPDGMELKLKDFPRIREWDDRYTLYAEAWDLAGNKSQGSVTFSVNRFGSVYTFSEETEALVGENGNYYTNREQDIVVTETNVDTLEFKEITCNLGGRLKTFEEGVHYRVAESGSDTGWKQYTYFMDKSSFSEEGEYLVTIYSRDRAGNASASGARGKKIAFAVDRTAPSVLLSGVEDGGRYLERSRQVMLDIQDNLCLEEVRVTINGEEQAYSAAQMVENDGKLFLLVESAGNWQELEATAWDAAGNMRSTGKIRFLVTPNGLIQFFRNPALFFSVCGTLLVFTGALGWVLGKKCFTKC